MTMDGWDVLEHARKLSLRGEAFALATVVWRRGPSSVKEGYRAVITTSGQVFGFIGGACAEPVVVREARRILAEGVPRLLFLGTPDELESVAVREGISSHPCAECVVSELDLKVAGVDERSLVVVATQGHHGEEAVEQALIAGPAYVGLVGSRPRAKSVFDYLESRGMSREILDRVKVPAGLDLGRVSHREIAVAVLAELVKLRAAGDLANGVRPELPEIVEAVDLVCGMTIEVGSARHEVDHGGTTYYCCCPGCLKAFEADPAAYAGTLTKVVKSQRSGKESE